MLVHSHNLAKCKQKPCKARYETESLIFALQYKLAAKWVKKKRNNKKMKISREKNTNKRQNFSLLIFSCSLEYSFRFHWLFGTEFEKCGALEVPFDILNGLFNAQVSHSPPQSISNSSTYTANKRRSSQGNKHLQKRPNSKKIRKKSTQENESNESVSIVWMLPFVFRK